MYKKILVLCESGVCLVRADTKLWEQHNLSFYKAHTVDEALKELRNDFHVLLVISFRRINARDVKGKIEMFRTLTAAPIIVVAEEPIEVAVKVSLLKNGADHFCTLPMTFEEASAEILALIRRFTEPCNIAFQQTSHFYSHGLIVDFDRRLVIVGRQEIELKKYEFDILVMLAKGNGRVYCSEQIYEEVWKEESVENVAALIQSHISRLRNRIQINPKQPNYIKTHYGSGYSFRPEYDTD